MKHIFLNKPLFAVAALSIALISVENAQATSARMAQFRVTVQNVTAGNGLSPYLVAVSVPGTPLFSVGTPASPGIALIAEKGDSSQLESELKMSPRTMGVFKAAGGPIPASESRVVDFTLASKALQNGAVLSLASMIGRSNDSFVSLQGIRLDAIPVGSVFIKAASNFDAGSEENTGNIEDFGAGGHPVDGAEGKISYDRGLNPRGNAPEVIGWGNIAALVKIERIR